MFVLRMTLKIFSPIEIVIALIALMLFSKLFGMLRLHVLGLGILCSKRLGAKFTPKRHFFL